MQTPDQKTTRVGQCNANILPTMWIHLQTARFSEFHKDYYWSACDHRDDYAPRNDAAMVTFLWGA